MNGKIVDLHHLLALREKLKSDGKVVVFTNGCFDIIHRGHVEYLCRAKEMGDVLVVGLNSDESVKRIKGERRPIVNEIDRAVVLSSFYFVDYVVLFDDDTPENLIKALKPDVLVKGADWQEKDIVGAEFVRSYGGRIARVKLVENHSTTKIINRIIDLYCKGE